MSMTTPRVTVPVDDLTLIEKKLSHGGWPSEAKKVRGWLSAAPAPEGGVVDDWRPIDSAPQDGTKIDLWGHWPERDRWTRTADATWDEERCDWKVNGFYAAQYAHPPRFTHWRAISGPAALATREEAPAEAEELDRAIKRMRNQLVGSATFTQLMFGREDVRLILDTLSALRAQPPAREDAQPVAWTEDMERERRESDYERGFRHGKKSALEDARPTRWGLVDANGRMLARTYESADEASSMGRRCTTVALTPAALYTHPAPDALRVAVEALEKIKRGEVTVFDDELQCNVVASMDGEEASEIASEALAALQAEQKGGA